MSLTRLQLISSTNTRTRNSKIHLVDLAGSERVAMSGVVGQQFKEATSINKSLSTLGRVIDILLENAQLKSKNARPGLPPYRDSLLTWILSESIGGNSRTFMIAAISPSRLNYEETLSTLRYSSRARQVINIATINEDSSGKMVADLKSQIDKLQAAANAEAAKWKAREEEHLQKIAELTAAKGRASPVMAPGTTARAAALQEQQMQELKTKYEAERRKWAKEKEVLQEQIEMLGKQKFRFERETEALKNQVQDLQRQQSNWLSGSTELDVVSKVRDKLQAKVDELSAQLSQLQLSPMRPAPPSPQPADRGEERRLREDLAIKEDELRRLRSRLTTQQSDGREKEERKRELEEAQRSECKLKEALAVKEDEVRRLQVQMADLAAQAKALKAGQGMREGAEVRERQAQERLASKEGEIRRLQEELYKQQAACGRADDSVKRERQLKELLALKETEVMRLQLRVEKVTKQQAAATAASNKAEEAVRRERHLKEVLAAKEDDILRLQARVQSLMKQQTVLNGSNSAAHQQVALMQMEHQEAMKLLQRKLTERETAYERVAQQLKEKEAAELRFQALKEDNDQLLRQLQDLQRNLKTAEDKKADSGLRVQHALEHRDAALARLEQMRNSSAQHLVTVTELREQNKALEEQLQSRVAELKNSQDSERTQLLSQYRALQGRSESERKQSSAKQEELSRQIKQLEAEKAGLEAKIRKIGSDTDRFNSDCERLQKELDDSRRENHRLEDERHAVALQLAALKRDCQQYESRNVDLESSILHTQAELNGKISTLVRDKKLLQDEVNELKKLAVEKQQWTDQKEQYKDKVDRIEADSKRQYEERNKLTKKIHALNEEFDAIRDESEKRLIERDMLQKQLDTCRQRLASNNDTVAELHQKLAHAEQTQMRNEALQKEVLALQSGLKQLSKAKEECAAEIERLGAQLSEHLAERLQMEKSFNKLRSECRIQELEKEKVTRDLDRLERELAASTAEKQRWDQERAGLKKEVTELRALRYELEADRGEAQDALSRMQVQMDGKVESLKAQNQSLTKELGDLQMAQQAWGAERQDLQRQVDDREKANLRLERDLQAAEQKLDQDMVKQSAATRSLERQLSNTTAQNADLLGRQEVLEKQFSETQLRLQETTAQKDEAEKKWKAAKVEMSKLNQETEGLLSEHRQSLVEISSLQKKNSLLQQQEEAMARHVQEQAEELAGHLATIQDQDQRLLMLSHAQEHFQEAQALLKCLRVEVEQTKDHCATLRVQNSSLQKQVENHNLNAGDAARAQQQLADQCQRLEMDNCSQRRQLEALEAEKGDLEAQARNASAAQFDSQQQVLQLRTEKAKVAQQLDELVRARDRLEKSLQQAKEETLALTAQVQSLTQQLSDAESLVQKTAQEVLALQEEVTSLQVGRQAAETERLGLEAQVRGLKAEAAGLNRELDGLQRENLQLLSEASGMEMLRQTHDQTVQRLQALETAVAEGDGWRHKCLQLEEQERRQEAEVSRLLQEKSGLVKELWGMRERINGLEAEQGRWADTEKKARQERKEWGLEKEQLLSQIKDGIHLNSELEERLQAAHQKAASLVSRAKQATQEQMERDEATATIDSLRQEKVEWLQREIELQGEREEWARKCHRLESDREAVWEDLKRVQADNESLRAQQDRLKVRMAELRETIGASGPESRVQDRYVELQSEHRKDVAQIQQLTSAHHQLHRELEELQFQQDKVAARHAEAVERAESEKKVLKGQVDVLQEELALAVSKLDTIASDLGASRSHEQQERRLLEAEMRTTYEQKMLDLERASSLRILKLEQDLEAVQQEAQQVQARAAQREQAHEQQLEQQLRTEQQLRMLQQQVAKSTDTKQELEAEIQRLNKQLAVVEEAYAAMDKERHQEITQKHAEALAKRSAKVAKAKREAQMLEQANRIMMKGLLDKAMENSDALLNIGNLEDFLQVVVEEVEEKEKLDQDEEEDAMSDVVASSRTEWDDAEDEEDGLAYHVRGHLSPGSGSDSGSGSDLDLDLGPFPSTVHSSRPSGRNPYRSRGAHSSRSPSPEDSVNSVNWRGTRSQTPSPRRPSTRRSARHYPIMDEHDSSDDGSEDEYPPNR
uniref:Kinesin motor domain-containing protein n=1 Tax=Eutreptiella gymnastica TaxID=73025 RepID=A0A7S1I885_9EUGL